MKKKDWSQVKLKKVKLIILKFKCEMWKQILKLVIRYANYEYQENIRKDNWQNQMKIKTHTCLRVH